MEQLADLSATSSPSPVPRRTYLFGRDAELTRLEQRLEEALRRHGSLVLISGEAGIGKTSLALALREEAAGRGAVSAIGRCHQMTGAPAFAPWHDLLADLQALLGLDLSSLSPPFGDGPAAQSAYHLMQSVVTLLRSAAEVRPLVMILDDLHWADLDTLELLEVATRRLDNQPLLVVAVYRSEDVHRRHPLYGFLPSLQRDRPVEHIRLQALNLADSARLVASHSADCTPELVGYLHARSEGNPFFLVELLRDLTERNMLLRDGDGRLLPPSSSVDVPKMLQQVISGRIARLGEAATQFLQVAAVAGEEWNLPVVERSLDWPEEQLVDALEQAVEVNVIEPVAGEAESYRFAHGLTREVLYAEQVSRRRKRVHERVGEALEASIPSDRDLTRHAVSLSHHFSAAEQWDKAFRYSLAAGDAARDRYASHSALRFYQQALQAMRRLPDSVDPGTEMALQERLGQVQLILNQGEAAEAAFTSMLGSTRDAGDLMGEARALSWLSLVYTRLSRSAEAMAAAEAALRLGEQLNHPQLLADTHWNLGQAYLIFGKLDQGRLHLDEAERLARDTGEAAVLLRCLKYQAQLYVWTGHYSQAELLAREASALARQRGDALDIAGTSWQLGLARGELGYYPRALEALEEGLEYAGRSEDHHYLVKLLNTVGWLHGELGDAETALRFDQQALETSRHGPVDPVLEAERYSVLNLATDRLQTGDVAGAEIEMCRFEQMEQDDYARFRYLNRYHLLRSQIALARGDYHSALELAGEAATFAEARGVRKNLAKGWMLMGQALTGLRRPEEAAAHLRRAVGLADELQHGSLRWQARLRLAQAHVAARELGAAGTALQQARNLVDRIASGLTDQRIRAAFQSSALVTELQSTAATLDGSSPASGYPAGLTAREVEVLQMVAQGATNAAIADALTISVKTVNTHVTSILNKTGCANRAAAAAFAMQHHIG